MWADAQHDGRPDEYRWRPLLNAAVWLMLTARVPSTNAANIRELKTWTQTELCTWQNSVRRQQPRKRIYNYQPRRRPNIVQVWLTSVQRRRCSNEVKTRNPLKFAGCPKPANRSQPLVDRSSPYCEDMRRRYCCLSIFF